MSGTGLLLRSTAVASCRQFSSERTTGLVGPAVRLLLYHYDISEKDVDASGPKKNLLKSDVMAVVRAKNLTPVVRKPGKVPDIAPSKAIIPPISAAPKGSERSIGGYVDIPLTNMRKTIAKRLSQSKQSVPHEYVAASVLWDGLNALRNQLKTDGIAVSVNDFIVKAAANALRAVPAVNVRWDGDNVVQISSVDISVAVATPTGLITPIVFGADGKGVLAISGNIRELAQKAKENRLQPAEFQGGSFTISNLGMFGSVNSFTAIINQPQAAILTVGGPSTQLDNDNRIETRCTLTLCYDGRAISPSSARAFLSHLSSSLQDPMVLLTDPPISTISPEDNFDYSRLL